jgi:hypothetical protein
MRADRRLCLDLSRRRLVEANTAASAFLLAAKGQDLEPEDVQRLGLVLHEGRVMQASQVPAKPEPVVAPEPMPAKIELDATPAAEMAPAPILPPQSRRSRRKY